MVKRYGWVLLAFGLFLVGLMGTVTFNMAPMMLHPGGEIQPSGSSFTGTAEQARTIFLLFGTVIAFGLATIINGGWQIVTGRRSMVMTIGSLALAVVLLVIAWTTYHTLK